MFSLSFLNSSDNLALRVGGVIRWGSELLMRDIRRLRRRGESMRAFQAGTYDIQDDGGQLLKEVVPDLDDVPDFVKTASAVDQESNSRLFALVMVDDGQVMKKFATADPGNTWLSTLYFAFTKDNLPEEAQKIAAANLIEACDYFDIEAPEMLWDVAGEPTDTNIVDV
ncbi:MAG: hypothetical protein GWO27_00670, partial [Thermoplasmata archaeon]|nr:hypothetical protein [Thermoplasmata archaeon]